MPDESCVIVSSPRASIINVEGPIADPCAPTETTTPSATAMSPSVSARRPYRLRSGRRGRLGRRAVTLADDIPPGIRALMDRSNRLRAAQQILG